MEQGLQAPSCVWRWMESHVSLSSLVPTDGSPLPGLFCALLTLNSECSVHSYLNIVFLDGIARSQLTTGLSAISAPQNLTLVPMCGLALC